MSWNSLIQNGKCIYIYSNVYTFIQIYRLEAIYMPREAGFIVQRPYDIRPESNRIYSLEAIYHTSHIRVGFTVQKPYTGPWWLDLPFKDHIWAENGRIYRLQTQNLPLYSYDRFQDVQQPAARQNFFRTVLENVKCPGICQYNLKSIYIYIYISLQ